VCATFFVLGSRVEGREEVLLRMETLGCEIGNHTFSHADLTRLSAEQCKEEIDKTNAEFERALGHPASVVRPPYGFYNAAVRKNVPYPLVLWTVDTNDWRPRNVAELADAVVREAEDGCVILMHDQQSSTAEAMDAIIPALVAKGFRFVTVSELIAATDGACKAVKMPGGG
ncbi:MAG: polysaccharide deacetylase family protein, partial [Clostridium sp.]|nr:polysaccharide deacetylase family protein [Clostridium sp.]